MARPTHRLSREERLDQIVRGALDDLGDNTSPVYYGDVHNHLPGEALNQIRKAVSARDGYEVLTYLRQMKSRAGVDEPRDRHFERRT